MVTQAQGYEYIFFESDFKQQSVNLGMFIAMHTIFRQRDLSL